MKKIVFLIILFLPFFAGAQPSEVTLVVTGEGSTKEEATNNALRSAVEQAFGVFVSSNTEILNEEIVKDEIATISSGNIKSYVENAYIERSDGVKSITLTALVSISQLVNYTKNHGYSTEFAGSTFGANMRLYELNRDATRKVLDNFYKELLDQVALMYDYKLSVSDPVIKDDTGIVQMTVDVLANSNTKKIGDYFFNKLKAIGSTYEEVEPLIKMGNAFYVYAFYSFNKQKTTHPLDELHRNSLLFSYGLDIELLNLIFSSAMIGFEVKDNCGNSYTFNKPNTWIIVTSAGDHVNFYPEGRTGGYRYNYKMDKNMMSVITRNTDCESGEVVYRLQHEESIDKSILFSISSFDIIPNLQAGICSVLSGLYGETSSRPGFYVLDRDDIREYADYYSKFLTHGFYIGQWISDENGVVFRVNGDRDKAIIVRDTPRSSTWNDMQTMSGEFEGWRLPNKNELGIIVGSKAVQNQCMRYFDRPLNRSWLSEEDPDDPDRALFVNEFNSVSGHRKDQVLECIIVKEIQSKKESMQDVPNNDDEAIEFLQKVYPNSIDGSFTGDKLCTDRFAEYSRIECDYDPIYQTQDCYSAAVLPNPTFSKYSKFENAYTVQWQRYEHKEKVTVIVVLKKEAGRWLIDNIVQGDRLLFDYSKPPVSIYVDF